MTQLFSAERPAIKAMLACSESAHNYLDKLRFPLLGSPKVDGIRGGIRKRVVLARSNDPLRNVQVQAAFRHLEHFDGEFGLGEPTRHDLCRVTGALTNAKDRPIDGLKFYVFDHTECLESPYSQRASLLRESENVVVLEQRLLFDVEHLLAYEDYCLDLGYEGLILRDPNAPYKMGRSTANEGYLLKVKRFVDGEFKIVGFEEEQKNNNVATIDARGLTKRSNHKENKVGKGTLGALLLEFEPGVIFRCGSGFDDKTAREIWDHRERYLGKLAKIKYFAKGMKDLPRHSVFLSIRNKSDL